MLGYARARQPLSIPPLLDRRRAVQLSAPTFTRRVVLAQQHPAATAAGRACPQDPQVS